MKTTVSPPPHARRETLAKRNPHGNVHLLLGVVAVTLLCVFPVFAAGDLASLPKTLERVRGAIVAVGTIMPTRRPPGSFAGTGFVVGDGRHVVTAAHVLPKEIDDARRETLVVLVGGDGGEVRPAKVLATDETHDLALLAVEGAPLPSLRLGDADQVREGEVYAFTGFPIGMVLGMRPATHRAMIAAITPVATPQLSSGSLDAAMVKRLREPYTVFQLDATAYPGNSGSPLYDAATGHVVAVLNKVFVQTTKERVLQEPSGIGYAIPVRHVEALLQQAGVAN